MVSLNFFKFVNFFKDIVILFLELYIIMDFLDLFDFIFKVLVKDLINFFFNWKLMDVIEFEELIKNIILVIMFFGLGVLKIDND